MAKCIFLGKLTIVTFANILLPIILKCLNKKRILRVNHEIKGLVILLQIAGFSLMGQQILGNLPLAGNLFIPSSTTRKNPPSVGSPTKFLSSFPAKYQFPCSNSVKTSFLAFWLLPLLFYHFYFTFILFVHSGHVTFSFDHCSVLTECCF